jgi:N-acylneuraminate cytidylyltransferase
MIEMLRMDMQGHDSINTASLIKKHLWLGDRPINYDPMNRPNTQLLPYIFALNYAINIISRYHMLEYSDFIGRNPKLFVVPDIEAIDIDTPEDWQMAEALYNVL